jgi:hypothetical protein
LGELVGGCDVVLKHIVNGKLLVDGTGVTNVDAPELLYRIERDDLLEQVVPVVSLYVVSITCMHAMQMGYSHTLPVAGFVNHSVHLLVSGCLTLKLFGSSKTVTAGEASGELPFEPKLGWPSGGEIGIVSSGTWTSVIFAKVKKVRVRVMWEEV